MSDVITNTAQCLLGSGSLDWVNDSVVACLYTSGAAFTADSEDYSATNELPTGSGYTQLNKAVTGKTVTLDNALDETMYDCDNITWAATGGDLTARYCAFVDVTAGGKYIYIMDFGSTYTANDTTDFKITISTSGVFRSRQG